jgi:hypothetical protein
VCTRGSNWALLGGPSTSQLGAMRVLASLALVGALVACGTSPVLKNERVEFWQRELAQDLHVGMDRSEIEEWGGANHLKLYEQQLKGRTELAAREDIPGKFSLLTGCSGWQIMIYVFLDYSGRMTGTAVHSGGNCL